MKLYLHNGYANMADIIEAPTPFILCIGGRGTGKTWGSLYYLLDNEIPFVYLRRTSAQMELVSKDEFSPIVKIGAEMGMALKIDTLSKYASGVYRIDEDGKPTGTALAYNLGLSSVSSVRSFDASKIKVILYDECIPERHEKRMAYEDQALLQCYESINRNRELQGKAPVKLVCLANANNMEAPVLQALGCIKTLDNMRRKGQNQRVDIKSGLSIFLLNNSPISAEKQQTALYKLTLGQTDFNDMALSNQFSRDNYTDIGHKPLAEYVPVAAIGSICLYRHKTTYDWYVSETISGKPVQFDNTITDRARFRVYCGQSWKDYFSRRLTFENVNAKVFYKCIMNDTLK